MALEGYSRQSSAGRGKAASCELRLLNRRVAGTQTQGPGPQCLLQLSQLRPHALEGFLVAKAADCLYPERWDCTLTPTDTGGGGQHLQA